MKIFVYQSFQKTPNNFTHPFKAIGRAVFMQKVQSSSQVQKIVSKWFSSGKRLSENRKYLVCIKDKNGYENALICTKDECWSFIKDCLSDEGIMSARRGKSK